MENALRKSTPWAFTADLVFCRANDAQRLRAIELRRSVYLHDLGYAPGGDALDDQADHLVACRDGEIIAAAILVGPRHRPFDIEQYLPAEGLLEAGRVPGYVGRFVVHPDCRAVRRHLFVQLGMLKLVYLAAKSMGITDLFMYTFEWLLRFYRGAFFRDLGISFFHTGYQKQMCIMHLDIIAEELKCDPRPGTYRHFLFSAELPNYRL